MKSRRLLCVGGAFFCIFAGARGQGMDSDRKAETGLRALQTRYAGVRTYDSDEAGLAVFGAGMNAAANIATAAQDWIADNAVTLGVEPGELRLIGAWPIGGGPDVVFAYGQVMDGLPVEHGIARVVVQGGNQGSQVVYASASLTPRPAVGFARDAIDGPAAVASIRSAKAYSHLKLWSQAEMVIFAAERAGAVRARKFTASEPLPAAGEAYTFFVSAATGRLLEARSEVHQAAFSGRVFGFGSGGTLPDVDSNPPQLLPVGGLTLRTAEGDAFDTDDFGSFFFELASGSPVNLTVGPSGPFAAVTNAGGPTLQRTVPVFPDNEVEFVLNQQVDEFTTAQINGFLHANVAHDFYAARQPGFTDIDEAIGVIVNLPAECNAFFNSVTRSINFFRAGACVNTAYSSVVAHEYGHFIVDRLRLRQGAFGEGFSDALAMLAYDDAIVGREFAGPGTIVRDPAGAQRQYPCCCEVHDCGQVLGGVWWEINENLQETLGPQAGLALARQLFTDWSQITIGVPRGFNSATPLTAIEVLTADDDDAEIVSGTPHDAEICEAFAAHGIACPGNCAQIEELTAACPRGRVRATLTGAPGTVWNLTLDGEEAESTTLSARGRGTSSWRAAAGEHEVCVDGCGVCTTVTCGR